MDRQTNGWSIQGIALVIGLVASLITILAFITGKYTFRDFFIEVTVSATPGSVVQIDAPSPTPSLAPTRVDSPSQKAEKTPSATATFAPATPTEPLPSPTPELQPTSTPTPQLPCTIQPDPELAVAWNRSILGCAVGPSGITWASFTPYQRGLVVWREDRYQIYGFFDDDGWLVVKDEWDGQSTPPSRGAPPAEGLLTPIRGTGWVWATNDTFFNNLGWATDQQTGFCAKIQDFERGFILRSSNVVSCHPVHQNPHADLSFLFLVVQKAGQWQRLD